MNEMQAAIDVVFGNFVDYEKTIIPDYRNPEFLFFQKEKLNKLSREAKELIDLLEQLPSEMFLNNGRIKLKDLRKHIRNELKWSWKIIEMSLSEIHEYIKDV